MYSIKNRQYVFRQSGGKLWNIFDDEQKGLCASHLTGRNTWTEPILLQKNIGPGFCAEMDKDDRFHIFFQDGQGSLFCSRMDGETVKTVPVLSSRQQTLYDKHFFIAPSGRNIHLMYSIDQGNTAILAHQAVCDGKAGNPQVVDYVVKGVRPYAATFDRSGTLSAFYLSHDGRYYQIGCKKLNPDQKKWSDFTPLTKGVGDCDSPVVLVDYHDIMHLCCQRRGEKQYELLYKQKESDRDGWNDEQVVHASVYPFNDASIACMGKQLIVFWVREDAVFHAASQDGGQSWSKPARYSMQGARQLHCVIFRSNMIGEGDRIASVELPASFTGGFRPAFYQEYLGNDATISAGDFRNMLMDSLNMLKSTVSELNETTAANTGSISTLTGARQHMEREMAKYAIRLGLLEAEVKKLKTMIGRPGGDDPEDPPAPD